MILRAKMKEGFFDRPAVQSAVDEATRQVLSRFGAYVRQRDKSSLRYRQKPSAPGQPPSVHRSAGFQKAIIPGGFNTRPVSPLKELIYFAWDSSTKSVVIGPEKGDPDNGAPAIIEKGGTPRRMKNFRRKLRVLGGSGEIRIVSGAALRRARKQRIDRPWLKKNKEGVYVAYAKLKNPGMVKESNKLNAQLYGPAYVGGKHIAARPHTGPAAAAELDKLPGLLKDSLKG